MRKHNPTGSNMGYNDRVWHGDPMTVAEAQTRFEQEGKSALVEKAVALYSLRSNDANAKELLGIRRELIDLMEGEMGSMNPHYHARQKANLADTLSTHFGWMSRQDSLSVVERTGLRKFAFKVNEWGLQRAVNMAYRESSHPRCLLELTAAQLCIENGDIREARKHLDHVLAHYKRITEPKHRVRVYAKLGMLRRQTGSWSVGMYWGVRALLVLGVPFNVRGKAMAALLGHKG